MKGGETDTYFSFAKPEVGIFLKMRYPLSKTDLTPALLALFWQPLKCCPFKRGLLFLMTAGVIGSYSLPWPLRYLHPGKKVDANSKQWSSPQPINDISVCTSGHFPMGNWDRDELFSYLSSYLFSANPSCIQWPHCSYSRIPRCKGSFTRWILDLHCNLSSSILT